MKQADIDMYRERLLSLRRRLSRDRADLKGEVLQASGGEASGGLSNVPVHPADLATHAFEEQLTFDLVDNEEGLIEEINAALDRLDKGVFGVCESCKENIPDARLQAVPYARCCIVCARKLQQGDSGGAAEMTGRS